MNSVIEDRRGAILPPEREKEERENNKEQGKKAAT
jgi:hypothetical protein